MPTINTTRNKYKKLAQKIMIDLQMALSKKDLVTFFDSYFKDLVARGVIANYKYYFYSKKIEVNVLFSNKTQDLLMIRIDRK